MKRKKGFIVLMALLLIVAALLVSKGDDMLSLLNYKNMINNMTINEVDLSRIADGEYTGHCDAIMVAAEVSVEVKDHKITEVLILQHKNGKGKAAESLADTVKQAQSLKVDTVAGCTASSKVLLKAMENALVSGYSK